MTRNSMVVGVLTLALGGSAAVAVAQGPGRRDHGPGGPGFGPGPGFEERLGLSEEQKQQVKALHEKHRGEMRPLLESARNAHEAFRQAIEAENADATAVGQAVLAMHAAEKRLESARNALHEELKSILTPEQVEKLDAARERGAGPGPGRGGPGFRPRRGPGGPPEPPDRG